MVLEFLIQYELKKPLHLFLTGVFFSSVSVMISAALFSHAPSMVVVAFMTLPLVYVFTDILKSESVREADTHDLKTLFFENIDLAKIYLYLFLGMVVGISVWFTILPKEILANIFSEQLYNLNQIGVTTGFATNPEVFTLIALNNIKLVLLCTLLSFVFSAGALFILSWNASVVGVAIGSLVSRLQATGQAAGIALAQGLGLGTAYYILHLVPEVVAYFYASVAGAFISSAMLRYEPFSKPSNRLMVIALALVCISIALILLGALVEIQISHQIQAALKV